MNTRKLALVTSFGALYYVYRQATLYLLPPPLPDFLILPVLIVLALSYLVVGLGGATYSAAIAGLLLSATEAAFIPFTILLALLFGVTIDIFSHILHVKTNPEGLRKFRLALALAISSSITGLTAFYATITANAVPYQFMIDASIIVVGVVSGAIAGYLVTKIWRRYFASNISDLTSHS